MIADWYVLLCNGFKVHFPFVQNDRLYGIMTLITIFVNDVITYFLLTASIMASSSTFPIYLFFLYKKYSSLTFVNPAALLLACLFSVEACVEIYLLEVGAATLNSMLLD